MSMTGTLPEALCPSSVQGPPAFTVLWPFSLSACPSASPASLFQVSRALVITGATQMIQCHGPISRPLTPSPHGRERIHRSPAFGRGCLRGSLFCQPQGLTFSGGCRGATAGMKQRKATVRHEFEKHPRAQRGVGGVVSLTAKTPATRQHPQHARDPTNAR